jgi:aspartate-semialdehyde dehydrogenase
MPEWAAKMVVVPTEPGAVAGAVLVFSALPTEIAKPVEPVFARAGILVCSNASAYRKESDVPILVPEVNAGHAALIDAQRRARGWSGGIVTNPNCTSTGMTVALKALRDSFGLKRVFAVSMQAISGAGYPGVASMDILDNVIPNIDGEETKVEWEPRKMIGALAGDHIDLADFVISAHTNRVAVIDSHVVCLSLELGQKAELAEVSAALANYQGPAEAQGLPSTPQPAIRVRTEANRPQPRLDRMTGRGMTTVVGRVRPDPLLDYKLVVLSHNTIRGAAGGAIYNGELLVKLGYVK